MAHKCHIRGSSSKGFILMPNNWLFLAINITNRSFTLNVAVNGSRHGAEGTHFCSTLKRRMEMAKQDKAALKLVYRGTPHNGVSVKSKPVTKGIYRGQKWSA